MKPHYLIIAMSATLLQGCYTAPPYQSSGQTAVGAGYSGVNLGIHYSTSPELVQVPGHPVYYDPRVNFNFFFTDRLYWVLQGSNWYSSRGYNGPWMRVDYYEVPSYVLRIPVRYYRQPPPYFRGWTADAPPRWGDHWGRDWEQRRNGWDRSERRATPPPAPRPMDPRNYPGDNPRPREPDGQRYSPPRTPQDPPRPPDQQPRQDQPRQRDHSSRQDQANWPEWRRPQAAPDGRPHDRQATPNGHDQQGRKNREEEWKKKREEELRSQGR